MSSKGTEALEAQHSKVIGKNVLARSIIQFTRFTPVEGGFKITNVTCADPAGSIPDFLKNKLAAKHANGPVQLADFMLTGA